MSGAATIGVVSPSELLAVWVGAVGSVVRDAGGVRNLRDASRHRIGHRHGVGAVPLPPPATAPTASVQLEPALLFGTQAQPAVLAPGVEGGVGRQGLGQDDAGRTLVAVVAVGERVGHGAARGRRGDAVGLGRGRSGAAIERCRCRWRLLLAGVGSAPLAPSSAMLAVLTIWSTPAARRAVHRDRERSRPRAPPPASAPTVQRADRSRRCCSHAVQPAVLAPALKVVLAGTGLGQHDAGGALVAVVAVGERVGRASRRASSRSRRRSWSGSQVGRGVRAVSVSVAVLLAGVGSAPLVPSSAMLAVLTIW